MTQFDNEEADRDGMSVNVLANNDKRTALLILQHRGYPRLLTTVSDDCKNAVVASHLEIDQALFISKSRSVTDTGGSLRGNRGGIK